MKITSIVAVGEICSNVLQRHCIRQINQCSNIGIGLSLGLSPDPKRGEQSRSMVNEVVGGVHNEVMREIRRRRPEVRPDLLFRLVFQLTESAHALAVFHPNCFGDHRALVIKSPVMPSSASLSTLIGAAEPRPENAYATAS